MAGVRCRAHSSKSGNPCKNWAVHGATVCRYHGGSSAHVRVKAQERLLAMVDPALAELARLIRSADGDSVKLAAIKDVLDRVGMKAAEKIETDSAVTIRVEYDSYPLPDQVASHANGQATNGHTHT